MDGSLASSSSFSSPIVHVRKNNRKFITKGRRRFAAANSSLIFRVGMLVGG